MVVQSLFPILLTRDLPQLADFYQRALGGTIAYRFDDDSGEAAYISLALGAASLGIGRAVEVPGAGDRAALWFYVEDVDEAFRSFVAAGGSEVQPPRDMLWGERVAQVRDLDGNLVNLGAASG